MIATESIIAQSSIARRCVGNLPPSIARPRAGNLHRSTDASLRSAIRFRSSVDRSLNKTLHQTHSVVTASRPKNQSNQQYSIIALTDSAGSIVERYTYTAYGAPTFLDASASPLTPPASSLDNRITYTGREWDSTLHLHHFRARMMDPQLGRFCSNDPIGFRGSPWILYEYARTGPVTLVDPTGWAPHKCLDGCRTYDPLRFKACWDHCIDCVDKFEDWKKDNPVNPKWDDNLPDCPCTLWHKYNACGFGGKVYPVREQRVPKGWEDDLGCRGFTGLVCNWAQWIKPSTHPGAARCIRSTAPEGQPTQQCCYGKDGYLITSGVGAGSPDRNFPSHQESDIDPWLCAAALDGNPGVIKDGPHMQDYLDRRPANNGNNCKSGEGDDIPGLGETIFLRAIQRGREQ